MLARAIRYISQFECSNPVLSKEMRTRMRGIKSYVVQGIYVGLIAFMMAMYYLSWWLEFRMGASPVLVSSEIGRHLYLAIFMSQAALVCLITPALTAGSITLEREQRTYEMLASTRLAARSIVLGKMLSGWLFVMILLTCSLPMAALSVMFGGVAPSEIFLSYVTLALAAFFIGSVGILFSAVVSRSMGAVLLTYCVTFAYIVGTLVMQFSLNQLSAWGFWGALNPFVLVWFSGEPLTVFGRDLPGFLPAFALLSLGSFLCLSWAIARLPNFNVDRALLLRIVTLLALGAAVFLVMGDDVLSSSPGNGPRAMVLAMVTLLVLFIAPFFVTGELPRNGRRTLLGELLAGMHPRHIFAGKLRGGWSFLLILTLLMVAAFLGGWALDDGVNLVFPYSNAPKAAAGTVPSSVSAAMMASAAWGHLVNIFGVLAAAGLCMAALGALGAALDSRGLGVALILLFIVCTHVLAGAAWLIVMDRSSAVSSGPLDFALLAAPFTSLTVMLAPEGANSLPPAIAGPTAVPMALLTALFYLFCAALFFVAAEIAYQVRRSRLRAREEGAAQVVGSESGA